MGATRCLGLRTVFQSYAERLLQAEVQHKSTLEAWQVGAIRRVWGDRGVQSCYERRREFQLSDSAK